MPDPIGIAQNVQPVSTETVVIKRYASRRLYNTETSDYVTLDDISEMIRGGRDVKIVDLKTGDDLTRQYLLQIIAEHEGRGETVLPLDVLTELVRSYGTQGSSVVAQFLAQSFDVLREGQSKMKDKIATLPYPVAPPPAFDVLQHQQQAFLETMLTGWGRIPESDRDISPRTERDELRDIKRQLAELQTKLARL